MERAAAGTEILVRRRGKPYARLGPADSCCRKSLTSSSTKSP